MNKTNVLLFLFIVLVIFVFTRTDVRHFDFFKGKYGVVKFLYKNESNENFQNTILLIDNLSNGINIGNIYDDTIEKDKILIGKYEFEEENDGKIVMIITKSNQQFLNGRYSVKIDTLEYNKKYQNFKITFSSNLVKMVCLKSTTHLNL
ncbi:hypothetical protein AR687_05255 [Flavobacteriaceae bacterium CRH]|nr:hypothetical protein AR687_05255 [Flavobacteriaceae bacterium CRH]